MFAILFALQIDNTDLARTLRSFHLIRAAVCKEERHGVPVITCN
jgi:hypothetical protein